MLSGMSDEDRQIGTAEAAAMLGVSRETLTRWVKTGKIAARQKLPGRTGAYLFSYAAVARLRAELEHAAAS